MRLRIIHTEASLGWGGQEIRILSEMEGMRARGHEVTLLCQREARIFGEAGRRGLPVVALPMRRKRPAGVRAMYRFLRDHPVDVVNTHSSTDTWLVALACLALRAAPALVRTRHVSVPVKNGAATRWLYRRATDHIVTTGESLKQQLVEENHLPARHITSVPTGIDVDRFVPGDRAAVRAGLGLPAATPLIGIVATLRSWKGHSYLIEAFARLPRDAAELVVVGDGPQREALARLAADLGVQERVRFAGNQADVVPWLQAFDVFALPSYANEGVPQSILQAMLCGVPIVSTPVGAIREAVQDGHTGLLVPPKDVQALRDALARLLGDRVLRETLAARARAQAMDRFSLEVMLDRMEHVLTATLAVRGVAAA